MFNNYMFDKKCHSDLLNFLKTKKLLILMDPPFGGRVEPLANTLKALNKSYVEVNRIKDNGKFKKYNFFSFEKRPFYIKFRLATRKVNVPKSGKSH